MFQQSGENHDYFGLKELSDDEIKELERQAKLLDEE